MSKEDKNEWNILVKELERNNSLFKRTVELVLRNADDPPPKIIRKYIADVLGGYRHWRRGSPNAPYVKWKRKELVENVNRAAAPLMAKLISEGHKKSIAQELAEAELAIRFRTTPRQINGILKPRKRSK